MLAAAVKPVSRIRAEQDKEGGGSMQSMKVLPVALRSREAGRRHDG
jgi:hypothetical protein